MKAADTKNDDTHPDTATPKPISDKLYAGYLDERKALRAGEQKAGESYERWVLTLAGGALGLSMTFARDFLSPSSAVCPTLLLLAWVLLVGAILLALTGIYWSQKACEGFREALDATLEQTPSRDEAGFWRRVGDKQRESPLPKRIDRCNLWSLSAFMVGMLCLCVFVFLNTGSIGS